MAIHENEKPLEARQYYSLYNYVTNRMDSVTAMPTTDEEASRYIPQSETVQGLYDLYRRMGKPVLEAMQGALLAYVGER